MARNAQIEVRELKALDLRLAGASYRQIGVQLSVSHVQAFRDVQRVLREIAKEPALEVRAVELGRLDKLMLAHWPRAIRGDVKATTLVLQIMDRRVRLLGLDSPQKIDITGWIREMAKREGLDPDQAVRDAEDILRESMR